jgi:hypothetical protein
MWMDFGKSTGKWRPGIFMGYAETFGLDKSVEGWTIYGRGKDIDYLWRVQPRIGYYLSKNIQFYGEIEYTVAEYIEPYRHNVANTRFILAAVYKF